MTRLVRQEQGTDRKEQGEEPDSDVEADRQRADKPDRQATRRCDDNAPKQLSTPATRPRSDGYRDATATKMIEAVRCRDPTTTGRCGAEIRRPLSTDVEDEPRR